MKSLYHPPTSGRILKLTAMLSLALASSAWQLHAQVTTNLSGANVCLVYNTSSSSSATGFSPYRFSGKGLVILGPQTTGSHTNEYGTFDFETEKWSPSVVEGLVKRTVQPYELYKSGNTNFFVKQPVGGDSPWGTGERYFGLVNTAKSNISKPTHFVAVSSWEFPESSLSDGNPIGSASLIRPWTRSNSVPNLPIWIARTLVSSSKFYDLNADNYDEFGTMLGEPKYLGEGNQARRANLFTSRTTYSFSQTLTDLVRSNTTLEAAAATVEAWLKSNAGGKHVEDTSQGGMP